jgi:hypothetical protein
MKTQIRNLRSGKKVQMMNTGVNYSNLGVGSKEREVFFVWEKIKEENPNKMKIKILGLDLILKAHWSLSGKSVSYYGEIFKEDLEKIFKISPSKKTDFSKMGLLLFKAGT